MTRYLFQQISKTPGPTIVLDNPPLSPPIALARPPRSWWRGYVDDGGSGLIRCPRYVLRYWSTVDEYSLRVGLRRANWVSRSPARQERPGPLLPDPALSVFMLKWIVLDSSFKL